MGKGCGGPVGGRCYCTPAALLRDADKLRDVVQDTFLEALPSEFASIDGHLAEWLFTVCRNRALDVLRKENRMTQFEEQVHRCLSPDPGPLEAPGRGRPWRRGAQTGLGGLAHQSK